MRERGMDSSGFGWGPICLPITLHLLRQCTNLWIKCGVRQVCINMQGFNNGCQSKDENLASLARSSLKFWRRVCKKREAPGSSETPDWANVLSDTVEEDRRWRKCPLDNRIIWSVSTLMHYSFTRSDFFRLSCIGKYVTRESRIAQGLDAIWRYCVN